MSPPSPHSKKHSKQLRWTWRKPPDKPKRPLSAYNLFFADVRRKLLEQRRGNGAPTHGIGFSNLAKTVAKQWKVIDPSLKRKYERRADTEHEHYQMELDEWKLKHSHPEVRSRRNRNRKRLAETKTVPKKSCAATTLGCRPDPHESSIICEDESEHIKQEPESDTKKPRPCSPATVQWSRIPRMKEEQASPNSVLEQDSSLVSLIHRGSLYRSHMAANEHRSTKLPPCIPLLDGQIALGKSFSPLPDRAASNGDFKVEDMDAEPLGSSSGMVPLPPPTAPPEEPTHARDRHTLSAASSCKSVDVADEMNAELASEQLRPSPIPFDQVSAELPVSFLLRVLDEDERQMLFESFPSPSQVAEV